MIELTPGEAAVLPQFPAATRMECARELRGVDLEKMCADLGIDPRVYEKWEEVEEDSDGRGHEGVYDYEVPPSKDLMSRVAFYLQFPLNWFYLDEMDLSAPGDFSHVSGSQQLEREMDAALATYESQNAN